MEMPLNPGFVQLGVSLGRSLPLCGYLGLCGWRRKHSSLSKGDAWAAFTIVLNLFKSNLNASRTTKPPAALYVPGVSEGRNSFWQSHLCLGGIAELWFKQ